MTEIPDPYRGTFVETRAILAAGAGDDETVREIVRQLHPGELSDLVRACLVLLTEITEEQHDRWRAP